MTHGRRQAGHRVDTQRTTSRKGPRHRATVHRVLLFTNISCLLLSCIPLALTLTSSWNLCAEDVANLETRWPSAHRRMLKTWLNIFQTVKNDKWTDDWQTSNVTFVIFLQRNVNLLLYVWSNSAQPFRKVVAQKPRLDTPDPDSFVKGNDPPPSQKGTSQSCLFGEELAPTWRRSWRIATKKGQSVSFWSYCLAGMTCSTLTSN